MSVTLYRKYRPQKFSDIFGQSHIVQTLSNAITHNRIGHAYLFTGPRGTGKTTMARLFAKAVNCQNSKKSDLSGQVSQPAEPCLECEICKNISEGKSLDIFEIDAASNTGVENIRELRETAKLPPSQAKYKIYIIDEVHMLSSGAFNALLKTLEEPPAHVIFILATTEIHKVPDTIISRCQRFDFTRISLENIIKKLSDISAKEGVEIEKSALEAIAISAEGGMRDAESLLGQVISLEDKKITTQEVEEILGTTNRQSIEDLTEALISKNTLKAISLVDEVANNGFDLDVFHKSILNYFRQILLVSIDESLAKNFSFELTSEQITKILNLVKITNTAEILKILGTLSEIQGKIKTSFIPQLPFEIAITEITKNISSKIDNRTQIIKPVEKAEPFEKTPPTTEKFQKEIPREAVTEKPTEIKTDEIEKEENFSNKNNSFDLQDIKKIWNEACKQITQANQSLAALLPHSTAAKVENGVLFIATKYVFYKDKLNENSNRLTVENVFGKLLGANVKIKPLTEEEAGMKVPEIKSSDIPQFGKPVENQKPKETSSLLSDAANLLGGEIVE